MTCHTVISIDSLIDVNLRCYLIHILGDFMLLNAFISKVVRNRMTYLIWTLMTKKKENRTMKYAILILTTYKHFLHY